MGTDWHVCIVLGVLSIVTLKSPLVVGAKQFGEVPAASVYKVWATPPEFPSASTTLSNTFVPSHLER